MLGSTNERRRHVLKSSPLGWSRTHNDPCITVSLGVWCGIEFFQSKFTNMRPMQTLSWVTVNGLPERSIALWKTLIKYQIRIVLFSPKLAVGIAYVIIMALLVKFQMICLALSFKAQHLTIGEWISPSLNISPPLTAMLLYDQQMDLYTHKFTNYSGQNHIRIIHYFDLQYTV